MKYIMTVLLLATALSTLADPPKKAQPEPKKPAEMTAPNTMCNTTYALCIKAPCEKKQQVDDKTGKMSVKCECVMETGWNMGPNSCDDRKLSLTSTYSNKFNEGSRALSCPQPIDWAWCYGAKCEKNSKDGKLATCTCPVITNRAVILVSKDKCGDSVHVCSQMWSAAYPAESKYANDYYFWWMHEHGHPANPPAKPCPDTAK